MVAAAKHSPLSSIRSILIDERVGSVTTDVVEGLDITFLVLDQNEVKVGEFESEVASDVWEAKSVSREKPVFGEDTAAFKVIEQRFCIP